MSEPTFDIGMENIIENLLNNENQTSKPVGFSSSGDDLISSIPEGIIQSEQTITMPTTDLDARSNFSNCNRFFKTTQEDRNKLLTECESQFTRKATKVAVKTFRSILYKILIHLKTSFLNLKV